MSIQAITAAWATDVTPPARKLVLLFMANVHNGSTGQLNPSVEAVARACGITACQARRHLHALIESGFLQVVGNANGGPPTATRNYRLNIDTPSADATPRMDATPSTDARDPSHPCTLPLAPMRETPSTGASRTGKNLNEPEGNRNKTRAKLERPIDVDQEVWRDFLVHRKGKMTPTALKGISGKATKAGLTLQEALTFMIENNWQGFEAEWYFKKVGGTGNRQDAIEQRNRAVGDQWLAGQGVGARRQRPGSRADMIAGAAAVIFDDATHV